MASDSYKKIWRQVAMIPEGQVASYGQIARLAGLPRRAARMIGRAMGAAPVEMALPWHRVVNAQGKIAIPAGTRRHEKQKELLEAEGIPLVDGQIDMDKYRWEPSLDELVWGPGVLFDPAAGKESRE
jgi:methylated-DNA-protein-cysteine methyltransferase-like protein